MEIIPPLVDYINNNASNSNSNSESDYRPPTFDGDVEQFS